MKMRSIIRIMMLPVAVAILLAACTKETSEVRLDPKLGTTKVFNITSSSATVIGFVVAEGDGFTEKGVCYDVEPNPTIAKSKTIFTGTSTTAAFNVPLNGLAFAQAYHARAYATGPAGTVYGEALSFTTLPVVPTVTTAAVPTASITGNAASGGGNVTATGGAAVTARGICWSLTDPPTVANFKTTNGDGTGAFTSSMTELQGNKTYYVRAYATNSAGTGYGTQVEFTSSMADIENNIYRVVRIGTQIWMAENLRTTKDTDNNDIANVTDNTAWSTLTTPAYCWYANNSGYKSTYGGLYNWITVNTGKLCPTGWHVPTDDEYKTLEQYLGMASADLDVWGWRGTDQGSQLKSTSGWLSGENGTNSSGFSALPGGYRYAADGVFYSLGNLAYWWTASLSSPDIAWYRRLDGPNNNVYRAATSVRGGKFIRCVKN